MRIVSQNRTFSVEMKEVMLTLNENVVSFKPLSDLTHGSTVIARYENSAEAKIQFEHMNECKERVFYA